MGYRIVYGPMPKVRKTSPFNEMRLQALTAVFLLLFVLLVRQAWPEGTRMARQFLLPGEQTATEAAFADMIGEIQEGESWSDAFSAFCRQIVADGMQEVY